jgi:phosphatidylinositol 4-kinase
VCFLLLTDVFPAALRSWEARSARVRAASPFGSRPGWALAGVIVKSGDDCRQELLALQLIRELGDIWAGEDPCGGWNSVYMG